MFRDGLMGLLGFMGGQTKSLGTQVARQITGPTDTPETEELARKRENKANQEIEQRTGVRLQPVSPPQQVSRSPIIDLSPAGFRQNALETFGLSDVKRPAEVMDEHLQEQLKAPIALDAPAITTPDDLKNNMATIARGTGVDLATSQNPFGDALASMESANPDAFNDIVKNLRGATGFEGKLEEGTAKAQELMNELTSTQNSRKEILAKYKGMETDSATLDQVKQGRERVNELRGTTEAPLREMLGFETERFRQLAQKLEHGGTGVDNFGFAMLAMVPLLAKLVNRNANVGAAYQSLAGSYQSEQARVASERKALVDEYNSISANVKSGAVALNNVGIQLLGAENNLASMEDANKIGALSNQRGILNEMDANTENRGKMFRDMSKFNEDMYGYYERNGVDISKIKPEEQETIGQAIGIRKSLSKMEKLEAKLFKAKQEGRVTDSQLDWMLESIDSSGLLSVSESDKDKWARQAPELIEYIQVTNEVLAKRLKGKAGDRTSANDMEIARQFMVMRGGNSPETVTALQQQRRQMFNADMYALTPEARDRARVDFIVSQIPGGPDALRKTIESLGGKIDFKRGMVWDVPFKTANGVQNAKTSIENFMEAYKQLDPRFQDLETTIFFQE